MVMYFSKLLRTAAFKEENQSDCFSMDLPSDKYLLVACKPHRKYMVPSTWTNTLDKHHPSLQCNIILCFLNSWEQKKNKTVSPYDISSNIVSTTILYLRNLIGFWQAGKLLHLHSCKFQELHELTCIKCA